MMVVLNDSENITPLELHNLDIFPPIGRTVFLLDQYRCFLIDIRLVVNLLSASQIHNIRDELKRHDPEMFALLKKLWDLRPEEPGTTR